MEIENLNIDYLGGTYRRLRRTTKRFTQLIVRDVFDYVDYQVNLQANLQNLINQVVSNNYIPSRPYFHLSPKSKGIDRQTVVLGIEDSLIYRFCIEQINEDIVRITRQRNIRGGTKITPKSDSVEGDDFYEKWFDDWSQHQKNLETSLSRKPYLVTTDISSYYESINILLLKDLIRSDIKGKRPLFNLLFYFLENTKLRNNYEVNTFNGLLQESIEASRILAYYFLTSHDREMGTFCNENNAEYYRFVDDMAVVVDSEVIARMALKTITASLRKLNLVSSIEKTSILNADEARKDLFLDENAYIDGVQSEIFKCIKGGKSLGNIKRKVRAIYEKWNGSSRTKRKNWIKILKRFYSVGAYSKDDFLFNSLAGHIINYPLLFSDFRIIKYILSTTKSGNFNKYILKILEYLCSKENLYPQLETNLLEAILAVPTKIFTKSTIETLSKFATDLFFKENGCGKSEYSRALSLLLIYKVSKGEVKKLAEYYTKNQESDPYVKKYLLSVSLLVSNNRLRNIIRNQSSKNVNNEIHQLVSFVDNLDKYKGNKVIERYINHREYSIFYSDKLFTDNFEIKVKYDSVRGRLLKNTINIYA